MEITDQKLPGKPMPKGLKGEYMQKAYNWREGTEVLNNGHVDASLNNISGC